MDILDIKVRVSETDLLGHINNASYFIYMEEARIDFLKKLDIDIENGDFAFMLVSAKCDFIRQGYFGKTLKVATEVLKIGTKSITLTSTMTESESEDLIARGEVVLVYFDVHAEQTIEIPESFKDKLQAHMKGDD